MERKSAEWACMHKTKDHLRCLDLLEICEENKRERKAFVYMCFCVFYQKNMCFCVWDKLDWPSKNLRL